MVMKGMRDSNGGHRFARDFYGTSGRHGRFAGKNELLKPNRSDKRESSNEGMKETRDGRDRKGGESRQSDTERRRAAEVHMQKRQEGIKNTLMRKVIKSQGERGRIRKAGAGNGRRKEHNAGKSWTWFVMVITGRNGEDL
ncbi:hypothetical protein M413DRAFT_286170 [Hebeloma cylindrosporum]|uniref:Uncharacterized protein n=1 Tax=Hebeloma cylindrosporum TaxID=76867 RepID=A0A0C3BIY7_HEBCY|nr:hypothetical protein M413DRAFT_286170 [Hebeloma cylindrosporum h7]